MYYCHCTLCGHDPPGGGLTQVPGALLVLATKRALRQGRGLGKVGAEEEGEAHLTGVHARQLLQLLLKQT